MKTQTFARLTFFAFFILGGAVTVCSQDLHFSQYFNSPLLVNPANTGFSPDVDWRAGINYRNQWASIATNPYKTMSAWGDAQLLNNTLDNGWLGIGGSILRDEAGSGSLTSTKVFGSIAYHQMLGLSSLISTGFNLGWVSQRVDFTKLTFDDQWNKDFFDATLPSNEPFAYSSVGYFDLQAGVNYAFFPSESAYFNAGFSAMHINRPRESFFSNSDVNVRVPVRYTVFLNGSFKVNEQWIVNPNVYVSKMTNTYEVVMGLNTHYNLSGDGNTQLIAGLYYRYNDAVIPMVGYQLKDYAITVNYDATISSLGAYDNARGAYELSIVKTGIFGGGNKAVKCPTVKFQ